LRPRELFVAVPIVPRSSSTQYQLSKRGTDVWLGQPRTVLMHGKLGFCNSLTRD